MNDGRARTDVAYVWPTGVTFEVPRRRTIYLDLNHWIGLAKANTGHPDGTRYRPILDAARSVVAAGATVFPLSGQHYMELSGIKDPRQRSDIATVMAELSLYRSLLCRSKWMQLEVEAAFDETFGIVHGQSGAFPAFGLGHGHAFGVDGQFRVVREGFTHEATRESWPSGPDVYDVMLEAIQDDGEWRMLSGPSDDDLGDC